MKTWGRILLVLGVGTTILIHQNSDILGGNRKPLNQGQVNQPTLSITKKQSHEPKDGDRFNTSSTCNEFHRRILQNGFATSICNGRLGNQLGFLSLGLEFHMKFGVTTVLNLQQSNELSTVIDMEKTCNTNLTHPLCVLQPENCQLPGLRKPAKHVSRAWIFKHGVDALKLGNLTDTRIVLPGFPFFIKSIATEYLKEFRSELPIRKDVKQAAETLFKEAKSQLDCKNCTIVTVHMRMGDYIHHITALKMRPHLFAETDYVPRAFKHVMKNYYNPRFVVLGESPKDLYEYLQSDEMLFVRNRTIVSPTLGDQTGSKKLQKGIDLLLLSMGDVVILTYGTFGAFGGLLVKDKDVFYPKDHPAYRAALTQLINDRVPRYTPLEYETLNASSVRFFG